MQIVETEQVSKWNPPSPWEQTVQNPPLPHRQDTQEKATCETGTKRESHRKECTAAGTVQDTYRPRALGWQAGV